MGENRPPGTTTGNVARRLRDQGSAVTLALLILLLLAGFFRFRHLGYSEFQGDEARAALLARHLVEGSGLEVLLWHKKGPLEILLPAPAIWRGDLREGVARLPFAVAGLLAVLAAFALGRRLWGPRAGWLAAMLLAIDGYLIAFSRIVQYQSLVVLFAVLAVWCAHRFYCSDTRADRYLTLAGICVGLGTWAHYEMILALPPVAWLVLSRGWAERWPPREWLRRLALPVALMVAVALAFYVPFVRHPQFAATASYIGGRRIGGGLYNMLGDYFARASFYNASYYVTCVAIVLTAAVAWQLRRALGRQGVAGVAVWLAAFGLLIARPAAFQVGDLSLAGLVFLPVLAVLFLSPTVPATWRAVLLWFAGPFFVAGFLTKKPHTHFYTMMPAAALLAGWALDRGLDWLEAQMGRRRARLGAGAVGLALLTVFVAHQYVVFIRHTPEYKRVYPEARLPGYWTPFGDELPRGGYFGLPYRAGWSEVRELFLDGTLHGDYDSNEEILITGWYTWGAARCGNRPRYYLVAWRPQDAEDVPLDMIEREYHLRATVRVGGQPKLWVWDREPFLGEPLVIDDRGRMASVGGQASPHLDRSLPVGQALGLPLPQLEYELVRTMEGGDVRSDVRLEGGIRFHGADYPGWPTADPLVPGGSLGVILLWEAGAPISANYSVFVHLVNESGETVAQSDSWPECGAAPTSTWQAGELHYDAHTLDLPAEIPAGYYTLRVGMYDAQTGRRLEVRADEAGAGETALGDSIDLAVIEAGGP